MCNQNQFWPHMALIQKVRIILGSSLFQSGLLWYVLCANKTNNIITYVVGEAQSFVFGEGEEGEDRGRLIVYLCPLFDKLKLG